MRIILLDDEPMLLELYQDLIHKACKTVTMLPFKNADEALRELLHAPPDMFITDINHVGLNGREMLQLLARRKVSFPILVTTGNLTENEVRKYGGTELNLLFLSKPFKVEDFNRLFETVLKIPHDPATADQSKTIKNQTKTPNPRGKLLIVDDDDHFRMAMRMVFVKEYNFFEAEDGPTAIELVNQHDIDVVVSNIRKVGMSGLELLEQLKISKPDTEVILCTGHETNDTLRKALQLGASDYLNKPFELSTMRDAISKAMRKNAVAREKTAALRKYKCD